MSSIRNLGQTLAVLGLAAFTIGAAPAQQVYVGAADQWNDLLAHPDQWQYVRRNADGFYVNFIEMDWLPKNERGMSQAKLQETAALFHHKNAYYESDMNETVANEQDSLTRLQAAGFTVPYTSLNYGWSASRAEGLKTYALPHGQAPRLNMVQAGPWVIGGSLRGDHGGAAPLTNADYRAWIGQADGDSTDGPMGLWAVDAGGMHGGSFSMVKFAHSLHKQAVVMLCPYGAGQKAYTPDMFLQVAQDCVHQHEDAGALPDIWTVFEYATSIAAVPEQVNGRPGNSTTGVAYWLLHHIHDPAHQARLDPAPGTAAQQTATARTFTYRLHNKSAWLDLCPVLRARLMAPGGDWVARYTLDGQDVTAEMGKGGFVCVGRLRLLPGTQRTLQITLTHTKRVGGNSQRPASLVLELMPHPSQITQVQQRITLPLTPKVSSD